MYTDEDLYAAVREGILEESSVEAFRRYVAAAAETKTVDEENFRLISGFNDIFVSIAAFILLLSAGWIAGQASTGAGFLVAALLSWVLSEFFVKRRRLALPGILFLASFVVSALVCTAATLMAYGLSQDNSLLLACIIGVAAAWCHWLKFRVPITVAAGAASAVAFLAILVTKNPVTEQVILPILCLAGILTFLLAMRWDAQDVERKTRKSDVAFWLHLLAAPLIVHPIFSALGVLEGESSVLAIGAVILLYFVLAAISIAVDRRALMVSSLVYVLYAFRQLFETYGAVSSSLAISGVFIGSLLLLLSAFWHRSRTLLLNVTPPALARHLPPI